MYFTSSVTIREVRCDYFAYFTLQSIKPLTDTIYKLSNKNTEVLVCYEDRMEGNKQYLKQQFFEVLHFQQMETYCLYHKAQFCCQNIS